jgi:hypothetical protein
MSASPAENDLTSLTPDQRRKVEELRTAIVALPLVQVASTRAAYWHGVATPQARTRLPVFLSCCRSFGC